MIADRLFQSLWRNVCGEIYSDCIFFKSEQERTVEYMSQRRTVEVSCKRSMQGSPRVPTSPKGSAQSLSQLGPTAQWGRLRKTGQRAFSINIKVTCWLISVVDCYWELAPLYCLVIPRGFRSKSAHLFAQVFRSENSTAYGKPLEWQSCPS